MKERQADLPLPPVEPSAEALREAFGVLHAVGRTHPAFTFEQAIEHPVLRVCLRNLAEARARAKAPGKPCKR
jgi:hypothetical protein